MEKTDIDRLRSLPIESVAERLGLRVERHKALCPFHDDRHPSLSFSVSRNSYKCFVCDAHGGVIDLAMKVLGRDFVETCHWLADEHNMILSETKILRQAQDGLKTKTEAKPFDAARYARFFEKPFINQAAGEFLFEKRRIDPRVVRWCRLTSWTDKEGTPWLQIPYFDIDGHLTGVQWRNLACLEGTTAKRSVTGGEALGLRLEAATLSNPVRSAVVTKQESESGWKPVPRFRFPYGSQCHIYNLPVLKLLKSGEELWIAEGCSDCWSLLSSGHKAIAIPSATLLKPKDLDPLIRLSSSACPEPSLPRACRGEGLSFHMFPDADIPGEKLFLQLKASLPQLIRHSLPAGNKDYSDYYLSTLCK